MFNVHSNGFFQSRKLAITAAKSSNQDSEDSSVYEDLPPEGTEQFEYSGMAAPIAFDVCFRAEVLLNSGVSINSDELSMDKRSTPEYENPFKTAAPYFRKDKDNFQVKIPCYEWTFIVTNNDNHESNEQKKLVKLIFPDYKLPTMWKRDKEKGLVVNNSLLRSKTWHPKEFLTMTRSQTLVPPSGWPKKVPVHGEEEEDSGIDNNMEFYFEIIGSKLANTDTDHSESGSITNPTAVFIYTVRTHFFLSVPKKYAFWATESENEKEFIPRLFLMWASKQFSYFISPKGDVPNKVGSLSKVVKNNEERAKQYNFTPVPRINRERFTILRNGANIMWIPPENNVIDYNQKLRGSFNETTGEMPPVYDIPGFIGMHVLTDWMNDKLSFVNTAGNLQIVDLLGSHPLDDVTITRMMHTKLSSEKIQKYFELVDTRIVLDNRVGEFPTFKMQGMSHLLMAYDPEITIIDVGMGRINVDLSPEQNAKFLQLCKNIIALAKKADIEIEKFRNESYMSRNSLLKVWNAMFGIYAPQGKTFADEYTKALERNRFDTPPDGWKPKLSNMPGLESFTPHQNKIVYNLQKFPKKVMYDVNPGGGKTTLIIADIMTLLKNNKIKRPAVSVPDYLVGGFCDEVVDKSEGKINAFPVKVEILRRIYDTGKDEKGIIKMLQSLPSNTIIVLSHNATKSKTALDASMKQNSRTYGTTTIDTFPILDMLKPVGIDYLCIDESSDARNLDSQVSKALQTLAATVEYGRIASGTIVLKSLADLPGQGALLTPAMYGDKESFERIQESDNVEKAIHDVTYPYAAKYVAKKREWAFLLPKFNEHFYTPEHCGVTGLTDKQRAYYNYLLDDALDKVMEEIGKRRAKDGDVDDVNDQEIENAFRSHLQKVEQFLVNPSSTVAYTAQFSANHPDKEDLISPKVRVVNEILKCHFGLPGANTKLGIKMDKANKVIVFGDHREASKHMMANIIRPDMCIHATAENKDEAVQEFKTNPSKMILVADGRGLGKGLNLQLASRVIFLEIEWAPGDLEQKIARIGRPDFKEIANRDSIDIDHVLVDNSIDFAKFGRLVSRIIDKSRFDEFGNPAYEEIIDQMSSLPLLRMNLKLIREFSTEAQLDDRGYIDSYRTLKTWEDDQFDKNRQQLVEKFSRIKGKPVTLGQAKAMALVQVEHSPDIMGTRDDVYTPYVIGMTIPDRLGLGNCVPIRQVENIIGGLPPDRKKSKKDKEDDSLEDISVTPGEKVITEFGPGTISSVLKASVRVLVHGFGEVTLDKSIVHIPATQKGRDQLAKALKNAGSKGLPFLKPEKLDSTYTKKFQDVEDTTPAKTTTKNDKTEKVEKKSTVDEKPTTKKSKNAHELIFIATSINGIMSICSYVEEDAGEALDKANRSWNRVPAFLNMKIKTWQGGVRLMEFLTKNYSMESDKKNGLAKAIDNYKKNKNRIVVTPTLFADTLNFFRVRHKKIPRSDGSKKQLIRPWYYVWEDELHVCFDIANHPSSVISQLKRAVPKLKNIATPSVEEGFVIKFFKSKDDALAEVNFFNNNPNFIISDVKEVIDDVNKLVVRKKTDKK